MKYVFLLGRQAVLSAVELMGVLTALGYEPRIVEGSPLFLVVEVAREVPDDLMDRLGGVDRIGVMLREKASEWAAGDIVKALSPTAGKKFRLGVSVVQRAATDPYNTKRLKRLVQEVKNIYEKKEVKVNFVSPPSPALKLNAAQVMFNGLDTAKHYELLLVHGQTGWYLGRTVQVQDIRAYEMRDTGKPVRAARVGMLPPKLAQIMLNMAVSALPDHQSFTILDPFCGSGTILQEGWLMDFQMIGMDKEMQMVEATLRNVAVLGQRFRVNKVIMPRVRVHDARVPFPEELREAVDAIVTEPYLGQPLLAPLSPTEIKAAHIELGTLYLAFFRQALAVLQPGAMVVCALPAFRGKEGNFTLFSELWLDEVAQLGYVKNQLVSEAIAAIYPGDARLQMTYARPDALVGRELIVWHKT